MSVEYDMSRCRPIPADVWKATGEDGQPYHLYAMKMIDARVDFALSDDRLPEWSGSFVKQALYIALTKQEDRNSRILSIEKPPTNDERWQAMLAAEAMPDELVALRRHLGRRATGLGMELARHTHIGIWDTEDTIDAPVRRSLVNNRNLLTRLVEGQPVYKIKAAHDNGTIVERKRVVMTHYGSPHKQREQFWTVRRDVMLVDFDGLDKVIADEPVPNGQSREMQQATEFRESLKGRNSDYVMRVSELNDKFEPLIDQPIDLRPGYLYPLLTTMYLREPTANVTAEK